MKRIPGLKLAVTAVFVAGALSPLNALAANKFIVKDSTGTVDKFVVTDTGSVGVGTNAPAAAVHVKSAGVYPDNAIMVEGNVASNGAGFLGYNNDGTTAPKNGARFGFIYFGSTYDGAPHHPAGFAANADADWTATSTPAYFYFSTTPIGSTTRTERLRITSSGKVGINTTTPTQQLEVNGGVRLNALSAKPACDATSRGTLWFTNGGAAKDTLEVCAQSAVAGDFQWRTIW